MVTLDVWRARIGSHHASFSKCGKDKTVALYLNSALLQVFHFAVCLVLLIIGNVEINPGPQPAEFLCSYGQCSSKLASLGEHAQHQRLHANNSNFIFECGMCSFHFSSFNSLSSHISKCHQELRNVDVINVSNIPCCHCEERFRSSAELCRHLMDHFGQRNVVTCPLQEECHRAEAFPGKNSFSTHLSRCHPGWRQQTTPSAGNYADDVAQCSSTCANQFAYEDFETGCASSEEEEEEYFDADDDIPYREEDIFSYLVTFYLRLEVQCLLPVTTIDKIAQSLSFISEANQHLMRLTMVKELQALNISEDQIRNVLSKLVSCDPLYLAHHKKTRGPDLLTDHLRKKHFKEYFPQVPVSFPNFVPVDPIDGDRYAYVPVKETLNVLVKDPSVQQEILQSFERNAIDNPNLYKDYTDGRVCKTRNLPSKRIDINIFQDSFNVTSMMTAVQDKTRTLGMYMTLGNLQPWQRTKLRAMHLVMLVLEKHVKKYRQKCFKKLQEDLKDLEDNGIDFMGENIPVCVQFFVGDNLGSHFLGGFVESFTASHFCRYCETSKNELKTNPTAVKPFRTLASYRHSALRAQAKRLKHHHGIKERSVFNRLSNFKVTDPGLPPCLGHDLFHGVVDCDLSSIITSFISRKWFTYELLCRRISQFKYAASDSKNKPAPFKEKKGKKKKKNLGGSAVQNWLLLRLLPFLIHDKIRDSDDDHWQLYLKLKTICEYACAPAITEDQVAELDSLVQIYLEDRKILPNVQKPKHHFLRHYADLIRQCGPLIHVWAMRFEQKHQFFKKVARTCNNFINLLLTLSTKCQLLFGFESQESRFKNMFSGCKPFHIQPDHFSPAVTAAINTLSATTNLMATGKLTINGIKYCKGSLLILGKHGPNLKVGWIEAILLDGRVVHFVLKNKTAYFNSELGIYELESQTGHLTVVNHSSLSFPCVQPVYSIHNKDCFSLKHSIPQ